MIRAACRWRRRKACARAGIKAKNTLLLYYIAILAMHLARSRNHLDSCDAGGGGGGKASLLLQDTDLGKLGLSPLVKKQVTRTNEHECCTSHIPQTLTASPSLTETRTHTHAGNAHATVEVKP